MLSSADLRDLEKMLAPGGASRFEVEPWHARLVPGDPLRVQIVTDRGELVIDELDRSRFLAMRDEPEFWG